MRTLLSSFAAVAFGLLAFQPAAAQEVGSQVSFTGCLAQEAEEGEEIEYYLTGVPEEATDAAEVELMAGEGVNMAPHVGHTVEISGEVVSDDDSEEDEMEKGEKEGETGDEEESELHVRVSTLTHVSASCEEEER